MFIPMVMANQLFSSGKTGIPIMSVNATERGKLPMREARGLYDSIQSPKNEKAPTTNPYAVFKKNSL